MHAQDVGKDQDKIALQIISEQYIVDLLIKVGCLICLNACLHPPHNAGVLRISRWKSLP